jgi:hypothetical protein
MKEGLLMALLSTSKDIASRQDTEKDPTVK